jgi:hypothetical protein
MLAETVNSIGSLVTRAVHITQHINTRHKVRFLTLALAYAVGSAPVTAHCHECSMLGQQRIVPH